MRIISVDLLGAWNPPFITFKRYFLGKETHPSIIQWTAGDPSDEASMMKTILLQVLTIPWEDSKLGGGAENVWKPCTDCPSYKETILVMNTSQKLIIKQ